MGGYTGDILEEAAKPKTITDLVMTTVGTLAGVTNCEYSESEFTRNL